MADYSMSRFLTRLLYILLLISVASQKYEAWIKAEDIDEGMIAFDLCCLPSCKEELCPSFDLLCQRLLTLKNAFYGLHVRCIPTVYLWNQHFVLRDA